MASSSSDSQKPKRSLFGRSSKNSNEVTPKKPKKDNWFKQIRTVFNLARRHDPKVPWVMAGLVLLPAAISVLVGILVNAVWFAIPLGVMIGILAAMFYLGRVAEKAAFTQIEGQPGASGAALNTIKRGWIIEEQPIAVDPRTHDVVYRAIGRPGVVLVTEGPTQRVKKLVDGEKRKINRVVPNVEVHTVSVGTEEDQVRLYKLVGRLRKLRPTLTKVEVQAVAKRLTAINKGLPMPKGIDPNRVRPDRKAMRGR